MDKLKTKSQLHILKFEIILSPYLFIYPQHNEEFIITMALYKRPSINTQLFRIGCCIIKEKQTLYKISRSK